MADDIRRHILLPLPDLQDASRTAALSRDEKLKEIISNIDGQQRHIRNNIILAAKARLQSTLQSTRHVDDNEDVVTPMDKDTPSEGEIESQDDTALATQLLLANLAAPYIEGSGDPCVTATANRPVSAPGIRQATPPPQFQIAIETLHQIDEYDRQASQAKDYYLRALERRRSSAGVDATTLPSAVAPANVSPMDPSLSWDPRWRAR